MSVVQYPINEIPLSEYISGKSLFQTLTNVWKCSDLGVYNKINYPPNQYPLVIYCHTDLVNQVLLKIKQYNNLFILISHNSDGKITYTPKNNSDANLNLLPNNLFHWFGQNLIEKHSKLTSIPVGLENDYWSSENKQLQIYQKVREPKNIKNLCYLNVNIDTNPGERSHIYTLFKNKPWITTEYGRNGCNFSNYINNIRHHHFVLCPEGNQNGHTGGVCAIGSHRVWETLYVGSIPIVKKSTASLYFQDLPILLIDNWEDITYDFLEQNLLKIKSIIYNTKKLYLSYWINKIQDYIKNLPILS